MEEFIGKTLGRYHIIEKLGEGGMASVYKAFDTRLEREVALKIIRREAFSPETVGRMLQRFEREAKALSKLTHTNIVPISDYGDENGSPYLVMPLIPGGTLKEQLNNRVFTPSEAAGLLEPIARALGYAHSRGILHRDVKLSNILITDSGNPMLSDFGVAKILEDNEGETLTGTGIGLGTPEYMAPEQWAGKACPASDQYSLGVVFYEMVTGHRPFTAETPAAVLIKQVSDPLPRPRQFIPNFPNKAEQVIIKALSKEPGNRYKDMEEFADALAGLKIGSTSFLHTNSSKFWNENRREDQNEAPVTYELADNHKTNTETQLPAKKQIIPIYLWITVIVGICGLIIYLNSLKLIPGFTNDQTPKSISTSSANEPTTQFGSAQPINTKAALQPTVTQSSPLTSQPMPQTFSRQNGLANVNNSGNVTVYGDWIYYLNSVYAGSFYRISLDGKDKHKISDDFPQSITVIKNYLYYSNIRDNNKVYRIQLDGTGKQKINDFDSIEITNSGDWIFYINNSDNQSIHRMHLDGSDDKRISDQKALYLNIQDDWIYFSNLKQKGEIFRMHLDGTGLVKINNVNSTFVVVQKDWIYYSNQDDFGKIYRMHLDGTNGMAINTYDSLYLNIIDDWIYFSSKNSLGEILYRMHLDGSSSQTISKTTCSNIHIIGDWVYCVNGAEKGIMYRASLEGDDWQIAY